MMGFSLSFAHFLFSLSVSSSPPPISLVTFQELSDHSFKETMKLEAVNPLSPEHIHVATVTKVRGQHVWLCLEGERK